MRWSPWEPGGPPPTPAGWLVNLLVVAAILALVIGAILWGLAHATLV